MVFEALRECTNKTWSNIEMGIDSRAYFIPGHKYAVRVPCTLWYLTLKRLSVRVLDTAATVLVAHSLHYYLVRVYIHRT